MALLRVFVVLRWRHLFCDVCYACTPRRILVFGTSYVDFLKIS